MRLLGRLENILALRNLTSSQLFHWPLWVKYLFFGVLWPLLDYCFLIGSVASGVCRIKPPTLPLISSPSFNGINVSVETEVNGDDDGNVYKGEGAIFRPPDKWSPPFKREQKEVLSMINAEA